MCATHSQNLIIQAAALHSTAAVDFIVAAVPAARDGADCSTQANCSATLGSLLPASRLPAKKRHGLPVRRQLLARSFVAPILPGLHLAVTTAVHHLLISRAVVGR